MRVSTEDQADRYGLQAQEAAIIAYAEREALDIVRTFSDALSGMTEDRPGVQAALASTDDYDHFIIYDHTRLGRNVRVSATLRAKLQDAGVQVHYTTSGSYDSDSETGIILDAVSDAMSEVEIHRFVRRSKAGRRAAVKEGGLQLGRDIPFGYDRKRVNGKTSLVINPAEASTVRKIFRWFAQGQSTGQIPEWLNEKGIKKHNGYPWTRHDLYRMLRQEAYIGNWYYGKTEMVKGKQIKTDRSDWVRAEVPAIIDADLWSSAQTRTKAQVRAYKKRVSHEYLLRQRIKCADCGSIYNAHTQTYRNSKGKKFYPYYMHNFKAATDGCPNRTHLKVASIEDQVKDFIMDWSHNPDSKWSDVMAQVEQANSLIQDQLDPVIKKLGGLDAQIERAQKAYTEGAFDLDALTTQVERINAERDELKAERRRLRDELDPDWMELEVDRQMDKWDADQFEQLGKDFYDWGEWLNLIEMFNVVIETNTKGEVMLTCKVESLYPLSVASPADST